MQRDGLVYGLVDNAQEIGVPAVAEKYRDLTICWSRYDYHGEILEERSIDDLLERAADRDFRYCLVLSHGSVIRERWNPEHWPDQRPAPTFLAALEAWVDEHEFLVAGKIRRASGGRFGLDPGILVVDLESYAEAGRPSFGAPLAHAVSLIEPLAEVACSDILSLEPSARRQSRRPSLPGWHLIDASLAAGKPVLALPVHLSSNVFDLEPHDAQRTRAFSELLGTGIVDALGEDTAALGTDQRAFLEPLARQATRARDGVFLWNIEPYTDIEVPHEDFQPPLSHLYSVAAGFKPNRILSTHGFSDDTVVTFFDYSAKALLIREETLSRFTGEDFPAFVGHLLRKFPPTDTFYQLWADLDVSAVDAHDLESAWQRELARWGGAEAFHDHWQRYRRLRHEFLHCDLLTAPEVLLDAITSDSSSVIWFSNAFFTMFSNWHFPAADRRRAYERFVAGLAERNAQLLLYGSDCDNSNVNFVRAGEYWDHYSEQEGSQLLPSAWNRTAIRL